jgi:hypothetical protein
VTVARLETVKELDRSRLPSLSALRLVGGLYSSSPELTQLMGEPDLAHGDDCNDWFLRRWALVRQDDHGVRYRMWHGNNRRALEELAERLNREPRHKQVYFVEPNAE